jgi:ATP-dependent helicase/nuclease subunit A
VQRTDWAVGLDVELDAPPQAMAAAARRAAEAYRAAWRDAALGFAARLGVAVDTDVDGDGLVRAVAGAPALRATMRALAPVLGRGAPTVQAMANAMADLAERRCDDARAAHHWLDAACDALLKADHEPKVWPRGAALATAADAVGGVDAAVTRWAGLGADLSTARALVDEWRDVELNAAAMRCGLGLLDAFRRTKRAQGVIDFADLESIAWRMLRDPGIAAYVQCRMDRRYRHLLFDEFQDTSSLQWRLIADWLQSYAGAAERPSVFVVGDPKQSIYRFRRAEARVFEAAKALLTEAFGARIAGTDTTRRNAPAILDVLNRCLPPVMAHYREQATLAVGPRGLAWRLPLARLDEGAAAAEFDWLTSERADEASVRHAEGLAIADAILAARAALAEQGHALRWSQVYLLARSRTGFEAYERALRERGLPVQSDRAGGLLRTLEGDDLRALLTFVRRPTADLAFAQVLASPLVGLSADSIAWIAAHGPAPVDAAAADEADVGSDSDPGSDPDGDPEAEAEPEPAAPMPRHWWPRLRRLAASPDPAAAAPFDLQAVVALVSDWVDAAARAPVHDFLDAVLAQVDAFARYPAAVDPAQREVAHANLCAMLGLALDVDAGRFPSLARFLRRLRGYDTLDDREGPSEGRADALEAIRLMTIHGSKGLEADLVVLADAHGRAQPDGRRLHVDWSPELARPSSLSFVFGAKRGRAVRQQSFAREDELREREDRNLLYVALTRARLGVIVSGVRSGRSPTHSWYTCLEGLGAPPGAAPREVGVADAPPPAAARFDMSLLHLPRLDVGVRRDPGEGVDERDADGAPAGLLATELGHALHRALELLPAGADAATVLAALHGFALDASQRRAALDLAHAVFRLDALAPAFDPAAPSANEFEIVDADGCTSRIDRLARVGDALWIIDYKWSVDAARRPAYVEQLAGYRALVEALTPPPLGGASRIRTVLVDATAGRVELDVDLARDDRRAIAPG